ncbi:CBS domain-containing protein (plasmid) [Pedobacter sp. BS3]|uniref:CBS domain-containing protein n=1 Tax=Pedobacter sp. BS3 TaxID=2567937 RepID=UPI0011EDD672|nr:CBS domain-containing protein [Pedobacter sp. BS3]TZF86148.1 CBS domain-containing protein [Pedobacter sp. BS3]
MKKISEILRQKPSRLISVPREVTVYEALQIMMDHNISAILVMDQDRLAGIFTERDYARKVVLLGKTSKTTPITEVMTSTGLYVISPDDSIEKCMEMMSSKHIRHLPVMEGDKVTGIVSIGDVVKFIIEDQKHIIRELENYIST